MRGTGSKPDESVKIPVAAAPVQPAPVLVQPVVAPAVV
jgi:hypothetical protein